MKNTKFLAIIALIFTVLFTACNSESPVGSLNKLESSAYLHNESGKKVTLSYHKYDKLEKEWTLEAGESQEIPDTDRWSMTNIPDGGKVVFTFEDGTSYEHICEPGDGSSINHYEEYIFTPKENNILDLDDIAANENERGSWKRTALKGNKVRYDYYIK
ncbi:MAG: hypothetical protein MJY85_08150 [Fibrobacter sp.]|nr:hypothetical protein [Fibrobacter sp.]